MPSKKESKSNRQKWSMYSALHDDVSRRLEEHNLHFAFHERDDSVNCINAHDTTIMGRFKCHNRACSSSGWSSKRIAITIRMYAGGRYNARVYHQRCKGCDGLSRPDLDNSYAERVVYRLKKWRGIKMDVPPRSSGRSKRPHEEDLCEGCKAGHCSQSS